MTDPFESDNVTITIKYGKDFSDSWAVFRGTVENVRNQIIKFFGFDSAKLAENTLNEVVVMATHHAHGMRTAGASLGATVLPRQGGGSPAAGTATVETEAPAGTNVWGEDEASSNDAGPNPIFAELEAVDSIDKLKRVWAQNQVAFSTGPDAAELLEAYKAKGKALKAAASA